MKKTVFVILILLPILFSKDIYSQPIDTIRMRIDSIANAYLSNPANAGLVIGIYRKRTNPNVPVPPEFFTYGVKSKRTNIRPDTLTLFKLGSVGKTFTATALAYYVVHDPNSVRLHNLISNYFPPGQPLPYWVNTAIPGDTVRISLLNLATHHGSLPDEPPNHVAPPGYTVARLLEFLGSNDTAFHVRPLPYSPGTRWLYSNTGFGTLGVVMENISGLPYDSLLINVFCNNLNMPDTRINLSQEQLSRLAVGYDTTGDSTHFALPTSPGFLGAGGNYSTMTDMIKYLAWNMGFTNSSLNNLLDTLHKTRTNAYFDTAQWQCLAWQESYLNHGHSQVKYIWKDGLTTGYSSYVCWVEETNTGVVVLSNSYNIVDNMAVAILRVLNPLSPSGITNVSTEVPEEFSLHQNYPNPFNPITKIKFDIPAERIGNSFYKLIIYDALGKEIATLVNQDLNPGTYEVEFNGENFSSGVYFYKLISNKFSQVKRFVLLK